MTIKRIVIAIAAAAALAVPAIALAQTATVTETPIQASFSGKKLGGGTGGTFSVQVAVNGVFPKKGNNGLFPPPSNHAVVHLPKGLKIDTKPFLKHTCSADQINSRGANTCPTQAIVGKGISQIGAVLGSQIVYENAKVTAFVGPNEHGKSVLNVYADARSPVSAQIVLHSVLATDKSNKKLYGQLVDVDVPPIPTAPGSPDASILKFTVTLSGKVKVKSHGKITTKYAAYLPKKCPKGGFPFKGDFGFVDGQVHSGTTTAPCPKKR